ncbi:MAG: restriction endonuclease subunit S [Pseudanabaena sp.]
MSVPKLRFPEFSDAGEWEEKKLGDIAPLQRGFDLPTYNLETGSIPVVYSNGIQNYHKEGMAKAPGLVTGRSGTIGKLHFIEAGDYWPHNTALWVTSFKHNIPKFVYFLYLVIGMERFASGSGVPTLNRNYVHAFETCIPLLPEQKKIADCLSSLDDRITLETQKLDTLKAHKKGLMQQLFPAEGETLPKLRFPEFRDSGDWEEKYLGEIIEVASGQVDPTEPPYCDLPHIGGENIESHTGNLHAVKTARELRLVSGKYLFNEGDVLYSKIRPALNKVAIPNFKGICSADIYPLRPSDDKLCRRYLAYLLLSETFLEYATKHSDRSKIPKINRDSLLAYKVVIPHRPEQQRIADCLTSLEDLIAAQSQAIDLLKLHKKGLMQQLFPSVEEVKR